MTEILTCDHLRTAILALAAVAILSSCSSTRDITVTADDLVLYPPPPDTTRIQYLTSISSEDDLRGGRSFISSLFTESPQAQQFVKPHGVAATAGRVFVSDSGNRGIHVIDLRRGRMSYLSTSGLNAVVAPYGIASDSRGDLFVADRDRGEILRFDQDLGYVGSYVATEMATPVAVAASEIKVFALDVSNRRVHVFDRESRDYMYSFPDTDTDSLSILGGPVSIDFSDGSVFVSDTFLKKIKVYSESGEFIRSIGSQGFYPGQFDRPKGVAVDRDGVVYVIDSNFEVVQMFNREGQVLMDFGGHYSGPGGLNVPISLAIDYDNLEYFRPYVYDGFELEYVIYVANQFSQDKLNVYGRVRVKTQAMR